MLLNGALLKVIASVRIMIHQLTLKFIFESISDTCKTQDLLGPMSQTLVIIAMYVLLQSATWVTVFMKSPNAVFPRIESFIISFRYHSLLQRNKIIPTHSKGVQVGGFSVLTFGFGVRRLIH